MTTGTTNQFWLVWRIGGLSPTKQHETKESAQGEAERLAAANPDARFAVMQSMEVKIATINPVQSLRCVKSKQPF